MIPILFSPARSGILLLLLQAAAPNIYALRPLAIDTTRHPQSSPFDSVPRALVVWKRGEEDLSLAPAGIDTGPFGDRPYGIGTILTITLTTS